MRRVLLSSRTTRPPVYTLLLSLSEFTSLTCIVYFVTPKVEESLRWVWFHFLTLRQRERQISAFFSQDMVTRSVVNSPLPPKGPWVLCILTSFQNQQNFNNEKYTESHKQTPIVKTYYRRENRYKSNTEI